MTRKELAEYCGTCYNAPCLCETGDTPVGEDIDTPRGVRENVRYLAKTAPIDKWMILINALNKRRINHVSHYYLSSKRWDESLAETEPEVMTIHGFELVWIHCHDWKSSCIDFCRLYYQESDNTVIIHA